MEKKTSSVEWLFNEIAMPEYGELPKCIMDILEQSKEIHEKQIEEAYNQGYRDAEIDCFHLSKNDISTYENAKNYYNETYKQ